ncbi:MAG: HAD hydrolase family protein [Cyanobacteria bacterium]|nr:HAD hydrolase family protein [Cyanobacteriota bacterium]
MFKEISNELKARAAKIKLIGFDVDGVLTDGSIYMNESGEAFKKFHSLDGYGLRLAKQFGLELCIISARKSAHVHARFEGFGFEESVHTGIHDKLTKLKEIAATMKIGLDEIAFIGDDALDIPILEQVGLAVCPPGAHYSVFEHIHYITEKEGGKGSAREFVDLILYSQGKIPG